METYIKMTTFINETLNKVVCECGCEMRRSSLTGHRKSKFHQEFIQSLASGGNTI